MRRALSAILFLATGCSEGPSEPVDPPGNPAPELGCARMTEVSLAPGESAVLDEAAGSGCIRLPARSGETEYLTVVYSAATAIAPDGISGPYLLRSRGAVAALASPTIGPSPKAAPFQDDPASHFHELLRTRERRLSAPSLSTPGASVSPAPPPLVGQQRTFGVCATPACSEVVPVQVTAVHVGQRVALLVDDALPSGGFAPDDLIRLGRLFDEQLHPLGRAAFGQESDVDQNGIVLVVMTAQVNRLCPMLGGVATGYFYGLDLQPASPGSNGGEVFFALVPDPEGQNGCPVTREFVERVLPGTFIHEFQHMISYNQHVLVRGGPAEESWLNEGLSHYAEELGGRRVPNAHCVAGDCLSQFAFNDISNAYRYLFAPEDSYLLYPSASTGRIAERGAAWLFVRWLSDHHAGGDGFTRALVATGKVGAANIVAATGADFASLLGEWHLANYLDDLTDFSARNPRLSYTSWNLRVTMASLRAQYPGQFSRAFPLAPDLSQGTFDRGGTLRGGSGRHLRVIVPARGQPIDLRLSDASGSAGVLSALSARVAIARIR
ncbi:MAG: hypothetical protein HOP28_10835 [Gemmatimonadales bacterium]|nr:hypothetical protein [Gemmatimonadales bacterium]